jgi:hypothetical protein
MEPDHFAEIADRRIDGAPGQLRVSASEQCGSQIRSEGQSLCEVGNRSLEVPFGDVGMAAAGERDRVIGLQSRGLVEIGDGLRERSGVGAGNAAVAVGHDLVGFGRVRILDDGRARTQHYIRGTGLIAVREGIGAGADKD